ncbi:DNA-binding transcriptional regulator, MarR family [Nocardioides alpinus]|uniref:DNA-binding transcriptional regulator, MarR family n=1 Tax=Nocardioides alpinus TaxID=748909 RepID=A0A1I0Z850_9ACTN|nr:MarR family transcriptional regulator [Nocardioides alpinus]PKH38268.1 MarR family transcriptional regulator [Nocardioides alpinus]SFB20618.1 DNA-binding transcriptional regulator, MarR family [Nocardioides alpinus]
MSDHLESDAVPPWVERGQERAQPPTLLALRDLVAAGGRVNHVVSRRAGLSETELVTLEHLSREQIGPAEVARRLEVSTAAATGIVDRLVARGHVERRPHDLDRRRTDLHITDSGRGEVVGHLMPMFVALDRHDASFTEEEKVIVERYLRGATQAIERVLGP